MLDGYIYIVITEDFAKEVTNVADTYGAHKYYASVIRESRANNLLWIMRRYNKAIHANVCSTKKEAEALAQAWNEAYENNGTLANWSDMTA